MDEQTLPLLRITNEDITEANRLSLHCPICAGAVENHPAEEALRPVICANCKTLYHRACWDQGGGKCAILGCDHEKYLVFGAPASPILKIRHSDLPQVAQNGRGPSRRVRTLKAQQRREIEQLRRPSLFQLIWRWLLDRIKIG